MSTTTPHLVAYPMHGESKLRREGLRTRDGHVLEWFARFGLTVEVISRPEPWPRVTMSRRVPGPELPPQWDLTSPQPLVSPKVFVGDKRRWWVDSTRWLPAPHGSVPTIGWNIFALADAFERGAGGPSVLDLLDDWSRHHAFAGIAKEVDRAYRRVFDGSSFVIANSEGTADLARQYGRSDVVLMPNGVDARQFDLAPTASGPRTVVGYGGKIGARVDFELVRTVTQGLPECVFEFAGPLLDRSSRQALAGLSNVRILGDVRYDRYPAVLASWDLAWIPHAVGPNEVGGDVIKAYEYRAAGLPTFTTPIIGAGRASGVTIVEPAHMLEALRSIVQENEGPRIARQPGEIPTEQTWSHKAGEIARMLDLPSVETGPEEHP